MDMTAPTGLGTLLQQVLDTLDGDVQAIYSELGISFRPRFFPVVQQLRLADTPLPVSELAARIGVSQPAVTQTLGEMSRAGLIAAKPAEGDRRQRLVSLSPRGEALCETLAPVWQAVQTAADKLDADLPHPLRDLLAHVLASLAANPFRDRIRRELT